MSASQRDGLGACVVLSTFSYSIIGVSGDVQHKLQRHHGTVIPPGRKAEDMSGEIDPIRAKQVQKKQKTVNPENQLLLQLIQEKKTTTPYIRAIHKQWWSLYAGDIGASQQYRNNRAIQDTCTNGCGNNVRELYYIQ